MERFEHLSKILVVVDPTCMYQPALEKAEYIAAAYDKQIHLYCCVFDPEGEGPSEEAAEAKQHILDRTSRWLERLAYSGKKRQVYATVEVEWSSDWVDSIAAAARRYEAQMLVKTTYRHSMLQRTFLRSSDAKLLRQCPCPALLVKSGSVWDTDDRKILLALKAEPKEGVYDLLNDWIIDAGHVIGKKGDFQVHGVHSYTVDSMFYDRRALAKISDIPLDRMHDTPDFPHQGIAKVAKEIDADIVMIGTRQNTSGLRIGDTVERALDLLPMDVLVMPVSGFAPA